jgi:hypothetical protein
MPAPRILSERLILPLAILLGFAGGAALCVGLLFLAAGGSGYAITWALLVPGALSQIAIRRRRVVRLEDDGTVTITWGKRWPFVIARHAPGDWIALALETVHNVKLQSSGRSGSGIAIPLPDTSLVRGRTRDWQDVVIADFGREDKARALRDEMARRSGIARVPFICETRVERGAREWQDDPFFVENDQAAKLYLRFVDATPAEPVDVIALATLLQIRRPWAEVARMEEAGWLRSKELVPRPDSGAVIEARAERIVAERLSQGPASEAALLAALEGTLGWADPDVLAYVLSRLAPPR